MCIGDANDLHPSGVPNTCKCLTSWFSEYVHVPEIFDIFGAGVAMKQSCLQRETTCFCASFVT